jgi:hypothetical protein
LWDNEEHRDDFLAFSFFCISLYIGIITDVTKKKTI